MKKTTLKRAIVAILYALYGCFDNDGWSNGGFVRPSRDSGIKIIMKN